MFSLSTLALLGAAQGAILIFAVLGVGHGNRRANRALAAFIAVLSLRLFVLALEYQAEGALQYRGLYLVLHFSYAIGPLLYLYVRLLVEPQWRLRWRHALHLLPVPVAALLLLPGGPLLPGDLQAYNGFEDLPQVVQRRVLLVSIPVFISLACYSLRSFYRLRSYRRRIREQFSALESINLNWLRTLVVLCLVAALLTILTDLYRLYHLSMEMPRAVFSVVASVMLIYYIGLRGLRQPLIFEQDSREAEPLQADAGGDSSRTEERAGTLSSTGEASSPAPAKYQNSGLSDEQIEAIWRRLENCMAEQKPFLQAGIKLADLARLVGTRPNYLSQTINSRSQASFFDYVNNFRIEYASSLLLEQGDMSISEVAMASGFNSQNVFNSHFKKKTGFTPSQYRKKKQ